MRTENIKTENTKTNTKTEQQIIQEIESLKSKKKARFTIEVFSDVEYLDISSLLDEIRGYAAAEITSFEIVDIPEKGLGRRTI